MKYRRCIFFHIARRLSGSEDDNGYPLHTVLTKHTSLSSFLQRYGLTFTFDQRIHMYVHGKEALLSDDASYAHCYLRERFGCVYPDFDFKGFAFGEHLKENASYEALCSHPELLNYLYPFIDDTLMLEEYSKNSSSLLMEYLVPIDLISFEEEEEMDRRQKQEHLLVKTLQRLYDHIYDQLSDDNENPVLAVAEGAVLSENYLIQKQMLQAPFDK